MGEAERQRRAPARTVMILLFAVAVVLGVAACAAAYRLGQAQAWAAYEAHR